MKRWFTYAGFLLMICLTLLSGALQGQMRQRWGPPGAAVRAAADLERLPDEIGDWRLTERRELDDSAVNMLRCSGYIHRLYENRETGEVVHVALLMGPSGEVAVHSPEICYSTRDYDVTRKPWRVALDEGEKQEGSQRNEVWAIGLQRKDVSAEQMLVYYGWSAGDEWMAAKNPRWKLGGHPFLYKLQLACMLAPGVEAGTDDAGRRFLADFIPVATTYMHSSAMN